MSVQIRKADVADAVALSALGQATFTGAFGILYKPEDLTLFFEKHHSVAVYQSRLKDQSSQIWVLEADTGDLVGYTCVSQCELPVPNIPDSAGELQRFYVREEYQGGGRGSRMLQLALDWLDDRYAYTYLSVFYANHGAQRLYKRYGFEVIHKYHYMVGNQADPEYIMERKRAI